AGQPFTALYHFRKAVEADPRFVPALEEQAPLALSLQQPGEAQWAYETLTKIVPNRTNAYVALIQLAQKRKDRKEMNRLFRKLQAVNPKAAAKLAHTTAELKSFKPVRKHAPLVKDVLEIPLSPAPGGTLLAEVSVNGSDPLTFIVDTGASLVSLTEATARSLGVAIDPNRKVIINTAKGPRTASLISIDRMEIQGIEASDVQGAILNKGFGPGIEGLLGQSFLQKINARIDVVKKVMVIE
ncbi:MAG: TIGR02281 family clan AA aspartic protease, partial [Candidatus Tectimicrobiota bacterium]